MFKAAAVIREELVLCEWHPTCVPARCRRWLVLVLVLALLLSQA
jgi:hypothetical protein